MTKTKGEILKENLFFSKKIGFEVINSEKKEKVFDFNDEYIEFLNSCKTERECVNFTEQYLKENGFENIDDVKSLKTGDKIYYINKKKAIYAVVIGSDILKDGLNIVGAHIDSPRLDLKPNPLYESFNLALFKTHYYGGIKKYQWTAIPLAIHGVIILNDGKTIDINIGEKDNDPIFTITDLLPHLSYQQNKKILSEAITGEDLNLLVGSIPYNDDSVEEKVKLNILNILNQKYGIVESDFTSAELELVPAFRAKSLGFDASMVAAYGQDDRACAYTALRAFCSISNLEKTAILVFSDKEEVGSMGNTGMQSHTFEMFISEILNRLGKNEFNVLDQILNSSKMLSADVTSALDPTYEIVDEKLNAAYLGKGLAFSKYTGSKGKSGASDANAEYVAYVKNILEKNNLLYQITDMGKVDEGGGGTIAYILANKGIDVIDCGVPVLSMHSPYEITSKFDIYNAYECYKVFYEES